MANYFQDWEFLVNKNGWANEPNHYEWEHLYRIRDKVLNPLREDQGKPVRITSGFRNDKVNRAAGGSKTSQHRRGEAVDFKVVTEGYSACETARRIVELGLPFDQLIWYDKDVGGHIHISYTDHRDNRGQVLHCFYSEKKRKKDYEPWSF